ncbi:putative DSB repair complex subunit Ku70 [Trichodelitschia bisporula]|uniref:ATP-dependent DNA helicase II subunit 1 n=1 Tax=Trichodelitschia bisporula TaxID=703511 RepID=A0A6G1HYB1_9PEZI|nr:putative DSB repair complex subunit Ku70 [Trichodelitschia bisporula]
MADAGARDFGRGDEEDDEVEDAGYVQAKDAVLFAIDVSSSMLEPRPAASAKHEPEAPASAALKVAYELMQQRIIASPTDMMGVLLFGTAKSHVGNGEEDDQSAMAYPHCYVLTSLDVPDAADVKRLKSLLEDEEEFQELMVPSPEPVAMSSVLFCANQIFTQRSPNLSSRRLFLITDNDRPHVNDSTQRSAAAVRAKDLYDLGVIIELFPITPLDHVFDRTAFYDDVVYRPASGDLDAPAALMPTVESVGSGDGISLLQSLLSAINSKSSPRRAAFSIPMEVGPGLVIGVKGYVMVKRQEHGKSCYIWVGGEKVQIAVGTTTQMAEDTARDVGKEEIRKAYKFGGEHVTFTEDEMKALKNYGDPVIRIIGFKPLKMLPVWATMRAPYFLYPNETDYVGSTRVFSALQQNLLKAEKFALAWFIPRRNAAPVLAAVIPGAEVLDETGHQKVPAGLWVIQLPAVDDIKRLPDEPSVHAPLSLVDAMKVPLSMLQLPGGAYDPRRYPNPALQWFYRVIQAIALEEDLPEAPDDKTIPRHKQIHKRAGHDVQTWGDELEREFKNISLELADTAPRGVKRSPEPQTSLPKRVKTEATSSSGDGDAEIRAATKNGGLKAYTVVQLKEWLRSKGLSTAGTKASLASRVEEYLGS